MASTIVAFDIKEPEFISQSSIQEESKKLMNLEDSARYKGVDVKHIEKSGNIAKELSLLSESVGLLILSNSNSSNWQNRKTTDFVSTNSPISVLVVPVED